MPPAISLVIPMYNRARWIGQAMQSVLAQTRRDFELVVWDDGSTDDSVAAARGAAGDDPRARVIAGEHRGVARSLTDAILLATGGYLGWIDSDDWIAPTTLAESSAVLDARPEVGVVYTDYVTTTEAGEVRGLGKRCAIPYSKDRLLIDFMMFQFRLMRRSAYDQAGGPDPAMSPAEDYDFCLRLSEVAQIHHLPRPLYFYRQHKASISSSDRVEQIMASKRAVERALVRRKMDEEYELDVQIVSQFRLKKRKA
jgi:glycosyltransferase involved in cell wall biosynthesis